MLPTTTHGGLWTGLACLLTLQSQWQFAAAADGAAQVADIAKASNDSLLWGPYRPNLYFGVRPRIPKSLMGGLLWTRVEDYQSVQNSKHRCHGAAQDEHSIQMSGAGQD
jgi:mannosyl-oligosaccharide glucosidase